ncbi:hypothetical protein D3C76_508390 [compost metagenome]
MTPIKGTRAVRVPLTYSRHSSRSQPKGSKRPLREAIASLMLGMATINAQGLPSTSAMYNRSLGTNSRSWLPSSKNSDSVKGTKPQLRLQASLNMSRRIPMSRRN